MKKLQVQVFLLKDIAPESSSLLVLMSSQAVVREEKLKNANWEIICQKESAPLE